MVCLEARDTDDGLFSSFTHISGTNLPAFVSLAELIITLTLRLGVGLRSGWLGSTMEALSVLTIWTRSLRTRSVAIEAVRPWSAVIEDLIVESIVGRWLSLA